MTQEPAEGLPEALEGMRDLVSRALPGMELAFETSIDELVVRVKQEGLLKVCQVAKGDKQLAFDYLRCLSGVEYPDRFEAVYHLYSTKKRHKLVIKTKLPKEEPIVDSVTSVWKGADWHEREAAEMFGITFAGHPHLVPLLLEEGLEERPLLKSHPLAEIEEAPHA